VPDEQRPTLSVVIPVHNGMPHLPETLASVLAQTRRPDEVVVVENGSQDGTAEWLATQCPPGVRVVVQPSLVSAADNWTAAIEAATGDLVKLVCADDVLDPRALELQAEALEAHPRAVLAAAQRRVIDASGRTLANARGLGPLRGEVDGPAVVLACALRGQNLLGEPAAVLFRRAAVVRHLPWDESAPYAIDLDMYSRVLVDGSAVAVRESLAWFRVSDGSWSNALAKVQRVQLEQWRDTVVASGMITLAGPQLLRAKLMARVNHALRLVAYRVAALRGRRAGHGA